jgi:hypothetical protein
MQIAAVETLNLVADLNLDLRRGRGEDIAPKGKIVEYPRIPFPAIGANMTLLQAQSGVRVSGEY